MVRSTSAAAAASSDASPASSKKKGRGAVRFAAERVPAVVDEADYDGEPLEHARADDHLRRVMVLFLLREHHADEHRRDDQHRVDGDLGDEAQQVGLIRSTRAGVGEGRLGHRNGIFQLLLYSLPLRFDGFR